METYIPFTVILKTLLLLQVQLLTRSLTEAASKKLEGNLVLSQLLWRHGDRSPVILFPSYSHPAKAVWPMGLGNLTPRGMQQHYLLGKELRKKYRGYLNESYRHDEITVWSTDFDRTLMSAQMNMAGLYGRVTLNEIANSSSVRINQPVPIHPELTGILSPGQNCPAFTRERLNVMNRSDLARNNRAENGSLVDSIKVQSGNVSLKVFKIADAVFCSDQHAVSLPPWIADNTTIKAYLDFLHEDLSPRLFMYSDKQVRLGGGPLLSSMIGRMKEKVAGNLTQKVLVYSAHDVTVMALLSALGVFDGKQPFYASTVSLDLFEKKIASDKSSNNLSNYFVVVNYLRGSLKPDITKAETLTVPGCESRCSLEKFVRLVNGNIPRDLIDECEGPNSKSAANALARDSMILTLSMVIAILVAVLFFACVFFLVRHRRLRNQLPTTRFSLMADDREDETTLPLTSHYDDGDLYGYNSAS